MINRWFFSLLLLAGTVALTVSADAQVLVSSHTTIEEVAGNRRLVPNCQAAMRDTTTQVLYPNASVICTLRQGGVAIQTLGECFGNPVAVCTVAAVNGVLVIEGSDYQATATHGVVTQVRNDCPTGTGGVFTCVWDPLSYGFPLGSPLPASRQFTDNGLVPFSNVQSFWNTTNGNDLLIASTAETQFRTAQVIPVVLHVHANQDVNTTTFQLNGFQNAKWTFIGSTGTTTPTAPSQGTTISFNAPSTVPVQQVDTITGAKWTRAMALIATRRKSLSRYSA